jgi:folate-dependent phosphoribosylglycinamide formyltransferase PurN
MGRLAVMVSDEDIPDRVLEAADVIVSDRKLGIGERVASHDEDRILEVFEEEGVFTAVALGYRRLFSGEFIDESRADLFNIHPSLLPRFKGLGVYRRVLESGEEVSGVTVHRLIEEMDEGEVIDRIRYPVPRDVSVRQFKRYSREYEARLFLRNFTRT